MQRTAHTLAAVAISAALASEAIASGVGASYYVPGTAAPPSVCSPGQCAPASDCHSCQRLGFACVDHATVAPCTAEGNCQPKVETFGWHQPNWRRWPGTADATPAPAAADPAEDALLPKFEPPQPEEEDRRAPPPIEDSEEEQDADGSSFDTFDSQADPRDEGLELNLPGRPEPVRRPASPIPSTPAPRVLPQRPAQPGFGDGPPSLPFGLAPPNPSAIDSPEWRLQRPVKTLDATPVSLPKTERSEGGPPPLPFGFTRRMSNPSPSRLSKPIAPRYDTAVIPTAAHLPPGR